MQLFNLILFWVFFGCLAAFIAKRRGRNPITWFFLGLFLGILGILLVLILPAPRPKRRLPTPPLLQSQRSEAWLKMWYYLDPTHKQYGPIEFPDLAKLRKENQISEKSLVWGEGMKEWKQLAEMPELIQEMDQG